MVEEICCPSSPSPRPPRGGPPRSRSNCVSLKSTPAPNAKSRVGESVYALMVFQTTRSIINIWRLGKCIRSLPSATSPRPAHTLRLATRCDEKQCQDDALFHSMRRHAIGKGRRCWGRSAGRWQRFGSLRHCLQHRNNVVSCICIPE